MSDPFWQSPDDIRRYYVWLRILTAKGWEVCDLKFLAGSTMQALAVMQYELGGGQGQLPVTVMLTPRVVNTHIAGFKIVRVDIPERPSFFGDLMPVAWIGDDITASRFCAGVAEVMEA
jgi:hypothetical protein